MANRDTSGLHRRAVLGMGAAGLATLAMPGYGLAATGAIKLRVYQGYFKTVFDKDVIPGFTRATGIEVRTLADTTSDEWLQELERSARVGIAPADVSMMSRSTTAKGIASALWAPLNLAKLRNSARLKPALIGKYPDGRVAAIGAATWSIVDDTASWVVSRASRATSQSHMFIDYMCRPEIQAVLASKLGTQPTLR